MDTIDVEALDATVEAARTAAVATLRTLADQLEQLPHARLCDGLG